MAYRADKTRYDRPENWFRHCGRTGLKLPAISLGCWHNFTEIEQSQILLTTAFDRGITHFDLANNYGPPPGQAETIVGKILKSDFKRYRDELIISSKAGYEMQPGPYGNGGSRKYLIASCEASLKRLKLDYVDIFYSHRFDPDTPLEETMGALDTLVKQGKALYAGISSYNPEKTRTAHDLLKSSGTPLTIHQPSYNLFNRHIEQGLIDTADELGVGLIVFCPLAQGLLTNKYLNGVPADSRAASASGFLKKDAITPKMIDKLRQLNAIAEARGQSLAQMALTWALRDSRVTSALIGASRPEQIEDNIAIMKQAPLTDDEIWRMGEIAAQ